MEARVTKKNGFLKNLTSVGMMLAISLFVGGQTVHANNANNGNNVALGLGAYNSYEANRLFFTFRLDKTSYGEIEKAVAEQKCKLVYQLTGEKTVKGFPITEENGNFYWMFSALIDVPPGKMAEVQGRLQHVPGVMYVQPNYILRPEALNGIGATTTIDHMADPYQGSQYYLGTIGAPNTLHKPAQFGENRIGLIDTGCKYWVPDLVKPQYSDSKYYNSVSLSYNESPNYNNVDTNGHGTMTGALMIASRHNGQGIAGINPHVGLYVLNSVNSQGYATDASIFAAMTESHQNIGTNTKVGVYSIGVNAPAPYTLSNAQVHPVFHFLASNLYEKRNCLIFVPSGNSSGFDKSLYVPYLNVVGATDSLGHPAAFSTAGNCMSFCAPGIGITTLNRDGQAVNGNGTSFAAAICAGVASAILSEADYVKHQPGLHLNGVTVNAKYIAELMRKSCTAKPTGGWSAQKGYGIPNIKNAIKLIQEKEAETQANLPPGWKQ